MNLVRPQLKVARPDWLSRAWTDAEFEKLTDADWKRMEAELLTYNHAVRDWNTEASEIHLKLMAIVANLYGANNNVTKYIESHGLPCPGEWSSMTSLTSKYKIYQDAAAKREKERQANELLMQATVFLTQRGKIAGTHFNSENAINQANEIRYIELVQEKLEQDCLHSFGGDDNCDGCGGWDGESRRCCCGNRRVYWDRTGNFTDMYIYGMAD